MKVFALLSDYRAHKSLSPLMHNKVIAGRELNEEYNYISLEIREDEFIRAMDGFRALNIAGANVTVPYKEKIISCLDSVSEKAGLAGAVNTVIRDGDKLHGDNTDIAGFLDALKINSITAAGKKVVLVGNGGAARGLIVALQSAGAEEVCVLGRSPDKVQRLASEFGVAYAALPLLEEYLEAADILVNTAAVSTAEEAPGLAQRLSVMSTGNLQFVVDINYGRKDNIWEKLAQKAKAGFIDGLPMLALQARRSFQLWTGIAVTEEEYLKALGII